MAVCETWLRSDLKKPIIVEELKGVFFSADQNANVIGVEVYNDGSAASLSGSVVGSIIRNDNATITVQNGTLSTNKASITLPQAAYVVPGPLHIVIRLISGTTKTVLGACTGYVWRSTTDTVTDPEHIVPSIDDLLALIDDMEESKNNCDAAAAAVEDMTATATTLSPGSSATATVTTVDGHYNIALGIPQGAKGETGEVSESEMNAKFLSDAFLTVAGTAITSAANLNSYTTPGNYRSASSTITNSLSNCPYSDAGFTLKVFAGKDSSSIMQWLISETGDQMYFRRYASSWSDWVIYRTNNATTSQAGYMSATDKYIFENSTMRGKGGASETNIDNIMTSGTYWLSSAVTSGWPTGEANANAVLNVFFDGGGSRVQELTMYDGQGKNRCYVRMYINSQWYPWRLIATGPNLTLDYGTAIASNSDLNSYTTPGSFYVDSAAIAATISHSPITDGGFTLVVKNHLITGYTCIQIIVNAGGNLTYVRTKYGNGWNSWHKYTATVVT